MSAPLFAAWWEPLIPVAMFLGVLGFSLLQMAWKRSQRQERNDAGGWRPGPPDDLREYDGPAPVRRYVRPAQHPPVSGGHGPRPSQPSRPLSPWEQEIERVLNRERQPAPAPTLPPPYAAPPLVLVPEFPPQPPPPQQFETLPSLLTSESISESADLESAPMPTTPLASLQSATLNYDQAVGLEGRVRAQMRRIDDRIGHAAPTLVPVRAAHRSPELTTLIRGLRTRPSARQAMLTAIILAPPKALAA